MGVSAYRRGSVPRIGRSRPRRPPRPRKVGVVRSAVQVLIHRAASEPGFEGVAAFISGFDQVRRRQDQKLSKELFALFAQSRGTYGSRRLQRMLARQAIYCGRNRILRLMRQLRLQVLQKRRFRPLTTQSRHPEPLAPNRLKQLTQPPSAPNQVWCADLTYLPSQQEGWLYLAAELDLCSKRVVGWKLASLAAPLVTDAFERAVKLWALCPRIHHSDRGVQYASSSFRQLLENVFLPSASNWSAAWRGAAL